MSDNNGLIEGQTEEDFAPEDDLDAFNDETFGGGGLGDEWKEDAHEELAMLTEQERVAMKQSQDFFNFGSDGEELGGELEDTLEPPATQNGGISHNNMVQRMDQLSLQGGLSQAPLTVQTSVNPMVQQPLPPPNFPVHQEFAQQPQPQQHQQVIYQHQMGNQPQPMMQQPPAQQFPLLPPSHFVGAGPGPGPYQDPAIMSLSKMPPPSQQPQYILQHPQQQPPQPQFIQTQPQQFPAAPRPQFSPHTVPGMKTLADLEAEMMYGGPRPAGPPGPQTVQGGPMMVERGGHVGHINPALHNLNYPGMRDRQSHQPQQQRQQHHHHQQQQPQQQQQHVQQQQQFRQSPGLTNQQQLQQGLQQHVRNNQHQQSQNNRMNNSQHMRQNNFNNVGEGQRRRNDNYFNENKRDNYYDNRDQEGHHRHRRQYNDPNRRNEETFGAAAVKEIREAEFKEYGDQRVTRRDLMPGHVHTLGILRHTRSRHDRHNSETFGEESERMAENPTGDPLLDARMAEEEEEMARRRKHYANSEDEYAGLMSQKDKQWIINIQLNQLKCDNPYVDDYYYTMFQARKEEKKNRDDNRAGNQLLLNESLVELNQSYTPAQFENSLGKLQCVTVKAPRQIIDVGVMRCHDNNTSFRSTDSPVGEQSPAPGALVLTSVTDKKQSGEYKLLLMKIEVLYTALLDLEADNLKLNALPTGAPLREQITHDELTHLQILQSGLSSADVVADCLAVAKGRSLVLRSVSYLSSSPSVVSSLLSIILANIHHVARNDHQDLQFWTLLAKYIDSESLDALEPAAANMVNLKNKVKKAVLATSLGVSVILTLILKASLVSAKSNNNLSIWSELAMTLLTIVAEGASLGAFLAKFHLSENTVNSLVNLDNKLKPAWMNLMELTRGEEVSA